MQDVNKIVSMGLYDALANFSGLAISQQEEAKNDVLIVRIEPDVAGYRLSDLSRLLFNRSG